MQKDVSDVSLRNLNRVNSTTVLLSSAYGKSTAAELEGLTFPLASSR